MITPEQCRAGRALLGWTQQLLAAKAEVGEVTVRLFESGAKSPRRATLHVIEQALGKAGVLFIREDEYAGPGVRLSKKPAG
jgi:transcriptional regulator with XRE-family HTH domain